ncbi:Oligoribonuclease [Buchnera aphidicola (Thelaxes suberi)]|uniref:oligoribonuclease n=1 Tax=Buchnera aphidicola TaxID=9 RepID=UPI0034641CF1
MKSENLIWLDLEMTGLDVETNYIIEIATLVTNKNLTILAEGPVIPIFQNKKIIKNMNSWNKTIHTNNGLIKKINNSIFNEQKAEKHTISFLKKWIIKKKSPLCGNTIGQDRKFLLKYMPNLEKYFHYRNIDVSTLKELVKRWKPEILKKKKKTHSALADIYASINELKYYREKFIKI